MLVKAKYLDDIRRLNLDKESSFVDLTSSLSEAFPNLPVPFTVKYVDEDEDTVTISTDMELAEAVRLTNDNNVLRLFLTPKVTSTVSTSVNTEPGPNGMPDVKDFADKLVQLFGGFGQPQEQPAQPHQVNVADLASMFQSMGLDTSPTTSSTPSQSSNPQPLKLDQFVSQLLAMPTVQQVIPQLLPLLTQLFPLVFKIPGFSQVNQTISDARVEHTGVVCNSCDEVIHGVRYMCLNCEDFDLCGVCKVLDTNVHDTTHAFSAIDRPLPRRGRGCPYKRGSQNSWSHHHHKKTAQQNGFLARFVKDVTIPDGMTVAPGQQFVKIWRLRNEGKVTWPEGTCLEHVGGDSISSFTSASVPVPAISTGEEIDVAVDMVAPNNPGRYVSFWKLCHRDGTRFGQRVWADILVGSEAAKRSPSQPTPSMELETSELESTMDSNTAVDEEECSDEDEEATAVSPEVQQLLDMGFKGPENLQRLLYENDNDMIRTVQSLLS